MARGDGGKRIFESEDDHTVFVARLGEACMSHGWQVHAWVLIGNHFHLLLETPQPNLVAGMKWLLGTFSQGWNRARKRRGHVFQGRYKAVPVNSTDADPYYFRIVADYIHLNPARAGLAGGAKGGLAAYPWSSLGAYASGKCPPWLSTDRVLRAFELARDGRGRRAYVAWLEARAAHPAGGIAAVATAALKRGWYLGEKDFRDTLRALVGKVGLKKRRRRGSAAAEIDRDHGERDAERLVVAGLCELGMPSDAAGLAALRKGDERKALIAALVRKRTGAGTDWIAARLAMGHPGSVSRLVGKVAKDPDLTKRRDRLDKMFGCGD